MLLGLLYRIIGDYFSYIGAIGGTTMAALATWLFASREQT